jgi:1-aminocyclopropane-1-carboxylate deaminase
MGADVRLVDEGFDIGIRKSLERAIEEVKAKGGKPYAIPAGASVHKYGGLGYVGFAEEVRQQEKALGFAFDYIVVCTVTGSTHAGMLVGFSKDGRARRVIGIDASATPKQTKAQVLEIARKWRPLSSGSGPARRRSRRNDGTAWGGRYFLIATSIVARQVNSTRL